MAKVTYKDLYTLTEELISKKLNYITNEDFAQQLNHTSISPLTSNGLSDISASDLLVVIQDLLSQTMLPTIIEGLIVTATDPLSASVDISAGKGSAAGKLYELTEDVTIPIPFDNSTTVFYLNLYLNRIVVEQNSAIDRVSIAKIVVPKPGVTNRIIDKRDGTWDAYIIGLRTLSLFVDQNNNLEEDSLDILRDNIGDILADNIIGNIRLSENLTISNTAGSVELDSSSVKIIDDNENILAKFNRDGVFFYDLSGIERSRFTGNDARIGNIKIEKDSIQSENFVTGLYGFEIRDDGSAEFQDVTVRGTIYALLGEIGGWNIDATRIYSDAEDVILDSSIPEITVGLKSGTHLRMDGANVRLESSDFVSGALGQGFRIDGQRAEFQNALIRGKLRTSIFEKSSISIVGGSIVVSPGDILAADMTALDSSNLEISGDETFSVGDFLRLKSGTDDEWLEITGDLGSNVYSVTRDKAGSYSADNNPTWSTGTAVVNYGASGEGLIYMTASDSNSPYIDVLTHSGSPWSSTDLKVRLGELDGIPGATGDGIYADYGYLGVIELTDLIKMRSTAKIRTVLEFDDYPYIEISDSDGIALIDSPPAGEYGSAIYGTDIYGYSALVYILNKEFAIPWVETKEPTKNATTLASFRYFNRSSNPTGTAEIGDIAFVNGQLVKCSVAGTPGTWTAITGGAGGVNNVYVEEGDVAKADTSSADLYIDFNGSQFDISVVANEANVSISADAFKGVYLNVVSKNANYILTLSDDVIICDSSGAGFALTLPVAASSTGKVYHIKKIDSSVNTITINETIDDGTTTTLTDQYESISIISDGSEWWIT